MCEKNNCGCESDKKHGHCSEKHDCCGENHDNHSEKHGHCCKKYDNYSEKQGRCKKHSHFCNEKPDFVNVDDYYAILDDGYERLYTPHRVAYINGESKPTTGEKERCPFCIAQEDHKKDPSKTLIIAEGKHVFVIMNLFPYNSGHIMVLPKRHIGFYVELTEEELDEFSRFTQKAIRLLKNVLGAEGYNIGINQGRLAGAGIAAHLHEHIIPRWIGDANFFPLIAKTRTIANPLYDLRDRLREAWDAA